MFFTRIKPFFPVASVAALSLLSVALTRPALAQGTTVTGYEKIAEGGNGSPGFTYREVGLASINQNGRVAFTGQDSARFVGIYTTPGGSGASTTTILTPSTGGGAQPSALSMNASGTVAYSYRDVNTNQRKVFSGSGGATTWVSDPATAPTLPNFSLDNVVPFPTINDAGAVAYGASSFNTSTNQGAFYVGVAQNGTYSPVAQSSTPGTFNGIPFNDFNDARINNAGQVAMMVTAVGNQGYVYRRNTNGSFTTIATQIQPETLISMNDSGFVSYFGLNNTSLLISNGLTTTTIATATSLDPVSGLALGNFAFNASVNNLNQVAFRGGGGAAPIGIYVGDGSRIVTVARVGDALFGSTIISVDLTSQSLNDLGQVIFTARLSDGRTEIVRGTLPGATPVAVPESSSLILLGVAGVVTFGGMANRRRRGMIGNMGVSFRC